MRLEVYLNARGERRFVGLLEERGGDILFEYDKRFLDSGIELSPFLLPLRPGVASDPKRTFDGLFGVFNDSLPDGWGLLLLDRLLRRSGLPLERITPLSRLSLVGSGGMGALEYEPVTPDPDPLPERIDLDGVADAIANAATMSREKRIERWQAMIEPLRRNDINAWRRRFLAALESS